MFYKSRPLKHEPSQLEINFSMRLNNEKITARQSMQSTTLGMPSSMPNGFLEHYPLQKLSISEDFSSESALDGEYSQDTDSFFESGDSSEEDLANEIKSRSDAEDELANIFGSEEPSSFAVERTNSFSRPLNPMVYDREFVFARCSAPSLGVQNQASFYINSKQEAVTLSSPFKMME